MSLDAPDRRRWWALGLLSIAQFLVIMDTSIIGIALPDIQQALGFSDASLQWVFNAYVIAFGGLLLLGGRLADHFGARRIFSVGFIILTATSLLAGLAWSDAVLVAARAGQGLGAALIAPAAMALVLRLFTEPADLGKAMGIWGAAAPAGGTAGVFLGGVITEWIDWRWTFLINVPIGVLVLAAVPSLLPRVEGRGGKLDLAGAATVTAALSTAVYAIVTANDYGWSSAHTVGFLGLATVLFASFVVIEMRRDEPLVPLRIFRVPNLSAANAVMALLGAAWIPMWFYLNLYLQQVLGYGAFEVGRGTAADDGRDHAADGRRHRPARSPASGSNRRWSSGSHCSPSGSRCSPAFQLTAVSRLTSSVPRSSPLGACRSRTSPS